MKGKVLAWSIIISLGGFLFGFDTAVISGAEKSIQTYWKLDSFQLGFTVSIALIGTIIGSLLGGIPSDRLGRKNTLVIIALLYFVSSLGTSFSNDWYLFLVFRFAGGLGVGASSVTAPIYISEISPSDTRGRLVALFQFNIVLGIVISFISNFCIDSLSVNNSWRLMLGIQAIPAFIFLLLLKLIPESPRWLISVKSDYSEAKRILDIINPETSTAIISNINKLSEQENNLSKGKLFSRKYKWPILLAVLFAFFNQVSGINAIIYYAPRIFEMSGLGASSALLSTIGIGIVNFTFTLLAINLIDKIGRKTLMLIGSLGLIFTLALVSYSFYFEQFSRWGITIYLLVYIAFFAFSQGAVIWVFISEIFPNEVRAKGQTLGSTTHWVMAALIAFSFPFITEKIGAGNTFMFFSVMMIVQLFFVWKVMPETKGTSLEQIDQILILH